MEFGNCGRRCASPNPTAIFQLVESGMSGDRGEASACVWHNGAPGVNCCARSRPRARRLLDRGEDVAERVDLCNGCTATRQERGTWQPSRPARISRQIGFKNGRTDAAERNTTAHSDRAMPERGERPLRREPNRRSVGVSRGIAKPSTCCRRRSHGNTGAELANEDFEHLSRFGCVRLHQVSRAAADGNNESGG